MQSWTDTGARSLSAIFMETTGDSLPCCGKPDFAMAGIKDVSKVDTALQAVAQIVKSELEKNA